MLLDVRLLTPDDALATYALARLREPTLTPQDWAAELARPAAEQGTFAAFCGSTPRGLLRYMLTHTTDGAGVVVIRWITAFDLIDPRRVAEDLIAVVREREALAGRVTAWAPCGSCGAGFDSAVAGEAVLHSVL
ncbi:MAG: hypothetical protein REJ23_09755 [Brevundimonas sp.]|nr:hypothetical protein [Brevundimonas sp.]